MAAVFAVALQMPASECPVSSDPSYATTRERPVQVGGGAMTVAARERRYLDALRGPGGQVLRYRRVGSLEGSDARTILDRYDVSYDGLEKPVALYLDAYHYDDRLEAPSGFICALPIGLNPPPPDAFLAMDDLIGLAIEQGGAREFQPISVDADGSATHGIILDQFRIVAAAARHATLAGRPLDPTARVAEWSRAKTLVIAFPLRCEERSIEPTVVELVSGVQGAPLRRERDLIGGDALARLLPGLNLPAGTVAAAYLTEKPRPDDAVRIAYAGSACGTPSEITLPLRATAAKPLRTPPVALPADQPETDRLVRLQALIDFDGTARRVVYMGGPAGLTQAAIEGVRGWTAEPARINGAPVITPVTLQVKFERR